MKFLFFLFWIPLFGLDLDQKIGQLFIIPVCSGWEEAHLEEVRTLIKKYHIGGVILMEGTIASQNAFCDQIQTPIPLFYVQDQEWGTGMRLKDGFCFPKNLELEQIQDSSFFFSLGQLIGKGAFELGVNFALAPVVDINSNPNNPIINVRSFGKDPQVVAERGTLVMQGIQSNGLIACAKHFPGHGDTTVDSHIDLPFVPHSKERLFSIELLPFFQLIKNGVKAVMSSHLAVPALIEEPLLPATFSQSLITGLLRNQWGFEGLIITDALNMGALTRYFSYEQIALNALLAGHDLLLYASHIPLHVNEILRVMLPKAFHAIKEGVLEGRIAEAILDEKIERILKMKKRLPHRFKAPYGQK